MHTTGFAGGFDFMGILSMTGENRIMPVSGGDNHSPARAAVFPEFSICFSKLIIAENGLPVNAGDEGKTAVPEDGGFCVQELDGYSRYSMETSASSVVSAGTIR